MPREVNGILIVERNRFSTYVHPKDYAGLAELRTWLDWFVKDNIRATIIFTDKGYALYREGMVDMFDDLDD